MDASLQRFPMTHEEIDRLMAAFYARIRRHDVLGPIFLRAVGEDDPAWREHEAKIASFWRNAILMDREYSGNPMAVHMMNPEIKVEHFATWLELFRKVAEEVLPPDKARNITGLANRIGQGLSYGVENARRTRGAPPSLR